MKSPSSRGRFEGVTKIVRFNTRFYIASVLGGITLVVITLSLRLPEWVKAGIITGTCLMLFWTLSSLLVSWYIYDHTRVMEWEWMRPALHPPPSRWANIHAGLDESTSSLKHLLPGTHGTVIDIYDPLTMTEPSIARARRMYPATEPFEVGTPTAIPLPAEDRDAIFLLFAAHEIRTPEGRTQLLQETSRVLKFDGQVVLVEHLRDLPNLVAFGPGFLHFHSARTWQRSIREAGFQIAAQREITPFVRCFTLRKVHP